MQQIQARIQDMGDESLEEQLQMAVANVERRAAPDFRLTRLASVSSPGVRHAMQPTSLCSMNVNPLCTHINCVKHLASPRRQTLCST